LAIKQSVVDSALRRSSLPPNASVFEILDAVGDPMQPFVMGMLCATAVTTPVILAGGTQMAAVLALIHRLEQQTSLSIPRSHILLATTPWVARDPNADLVGILDDGGAWAGAVPDLDFSTMECVSLRAYEQLMVKEGVGAGGACVAALALGRASIEDVHREIDAQYLRLLSSDRD
jgi:NaMN:DMB phosphoribosyltransferase